MSKNQGSNLLCFFGSDLEGRRSTDFLKKQFQQGYILLPLDPAAVARAVEADLPYSLIDDFIDIKMIAESIEIAGEAEKNWFESSRQAFTIEGICWPELDRSAMTWFWRDSILALALADQLKKIKINQFKYFQNLLRRPAIEDCRSDVCAALWKKELLDRACEIVTQNLTDQESSTSLLRRLCERLKDFSFDRKPRKLENTLSGKVALVIGLSEAHRFTHVINQFSDQFDKRLAVVFITPSTGSDHDKINGDVPLLYGPSWPLSWWASVITTFVPINLYGEAVEKFDSGFREAFDKAKGKPWRRPMELAFHFKYYIRYRWPRLHKHNFQFWLEFWNKSTPRALIFSWRHESIHRVAALAAKKLGIPTFSIPHGGVHQWAHDSNPEIDQILCSSILQKKLYMNTGITEKKLTLCKGLLAENEYPVQTAKAFAAEGKWRVLALTEPIHAGFVLFRHIRISRQIAALRALSGPPTDISQRLDLIIKTHPGWPESELIGAANKTLLKLTMPPDSELKPVLLGADLIIAVNYLGTALIHALLAKKPIILFLTEDSTLLKYHPVPYDIFSAGVVKVSTAQELWETVGSFFNNPDTARTMREKAAQFARTELEDDSMPTIREVLADYLTNPNQSVSSIC